MRLLLLVAVGFSTGCGVDSTRAMWHQRWTDPGCGVAHGAARTGEVTAKVVITPATVVVDVVTDPLTWECLVAVGQATLECSAQCCR